jgi:hypothetical protein
LNRNTGDWDDDEPMNPMHEAHHDLEGFYMVLVIFCILFEQTHQPKNLHPNCEHKPQFLQPNQALPAAIIGWYTGETWNEFGLRDCVLIFGVHWTFETKILTSLSSYLKAMAPYLERI